MRRDSASRRGRAGVAEDQIGEVTLSSVAADFVGGNDGDAAAFVDGHARAIDGSAVISACQLIDPGTKESVIHGRQAAALFDIQEYHGARWKTFPFCGCRGLACVACPPLHGRRQQALLAAEDALLRPFLLEFAALWAAIENQETKAQRAKEFAFAKPGI